MIPQLKEQLIKEYSYRTELHAHSLPISKCSEFQPEALARVYGKLGVDAVVLTNHFTPRHLMGRTAEELARDYIETFRAFRRYAEEEGFAAIFGMELRFSENMNDYLLYGLDEEDAYRIAELLDVGLVRFREEFQKEGYLLVQAHPKRDGMTDMPPECLDGYEGFNMHPGHNSRPAFSRRMAEEVAHVVTGGTDFHHPTHEGCCLLRTRTRLENAHDVARALRSGDYVLDIFGTILLP